MDLKNDIYTNDILMYREHALKDNIGIAGSQISINRDILAYY